MSNFKVVRNAAGELVCYGPNSDQYGPSIAVGNVLTIEASVPAVVITTRQTSAWQAIKAKREKVQYSGVLIGTKWFDTDENSRMMYNVLLTTSIEKSLAITVVLEANWKTMDGTFVPMTVELLRQIRDTMTLAVSANFANAEKHKAAMMLSIDPETYSYSTGWTQGYVL